MLALEPTTTAADTAARLLDPVLHALPAGARVVGKARWWGRSFVGGAYPCDDCTVRGLAAVVFDGCRDARCVRTCPRGPILARGFERMN